MVITCHVNERNQPLKNEKNTCQHFQLWCLHQPPARSTQAYYTLGVSLESSGSGSQGANLRCLKGTGKPRGKKNTDIEMDGCHLGTWYKLYFNQQPATSNEKHQKSPRPSRLHTAATWHLKRPDLKRKPKGQKPLELGEQQIHNQPTLIWCFGLVVWCSAKVAVSIILSDFFNIEKTQAGTSFPSQQTFLSIFFKD